MKKVLKVCAGIAAIGIVGINAYVVGAAMPMTWSVYKGDYERANACAEAIVVLHGRNSVLTEIILETAKNAVNNTLKREGSERRVTYRN